MYRTLQIILIVVASTALVSCTDECPEGPNSDSLYCHNGQSAADGTGGGGAGDQLDDAGEVCEEGETACAGECTNTTGDPLNCGECGKECPVGAECLASGCVCPDGTIECGGACINPNSDDMYCGATLDCQGDNAGEQCTGDDTCAAGACVTTRIYVGSLPQSKGQWNYMNSLGLDAAAGACSQIEPGAVVCTRARLLEAANTLNPLNNRSELAGATDTLGNPVDEWWVDDPAAPANRRCVNTKGPGQNGGVASQFVGKPWTYPTNDLGNDGYVVTLASQSEGVIDKNGAGQLDLRVDDCSDQNFVPCCMP